MLEKIRFALLSSEGNGQLALRAKAVLGALLSVLVILAPTLGWTFTQQDAGNILDSLLKIIGALGTLGSAFAFLVGWVRNTFNKKNKLGKYA